MAEQHRGEFRDLAATQGKQHGVLKEGKSQLRGVLSGFSADAAEKHEKHAAVLEAMSGQLREFDRQLVQKSGELLEHIQAQGG